MLNQTCSKGVISTIYLCICKYINSVKPKILQRKTSQKYLIIYLLAKSDKTNSQPNSPTVNIYSIKTQHLPSTLNMYITDFIIYAIYYIENLYIYIYTYMYIYLYTHMWHIIEGLSSMIGCHGQTDENIIKYYRQPKRKESNFIYYY